jgi:hypothetical protein
MTTAQRYIREETTEAGRDGRTNNGSDGRALGADAVAVKSLALADALAWAAAILSAVAAVAGLTIVGLYRDAPFWVQQAQGIDLATLFLAVPILLVSLWTARRGSPLGRLAAVGGLLYLIYNDAIYATSVAMNPLAAMYIAILGLSVWSLALSLLSTDLKDAGRALVGRLPRRATAWLLLIVAALFGLLWLSQITAFTLTGVIPADLERADLPANPVYALDLALFLPLAVVAGFGLLRDNARAAAFAYPMLIWVILTSAGVASGFLFAAMAGNEVPGVVAAVIGGVGGLAGLCAAIPIVRRPATTNA